MRFHESGNPAHGYASVAVRSSVEGADPQQLVQMLMDGALARIAAATGHIQRNELAGKALSIGQATSIIGGLKGSLDLDRGGDIARNLDDLYDYMARRLLLANVENDPEILREVHGLLAELRSAWAAMENRTSVEGTHQGPPQQSSFRV